jgi:hypothetical protein
MVGSIRTNAHAVAPDRAATGKVLRSVFALEVRESLLDHREIFDAGDDPQRPTADRTGLDAEDAFKALCSETSAFWRRGRIAAASQQDRSVEHAIPTGSSHQTNGSSLFSIDNIFTLSRYLDQS